MSSFTNKRTWDNEVISLANSKKIRLSSNESRSESAEASSSATQAVSSTDTSSVSSGVSMMEKVRAFSAEEDKALLNAIGSMAPSDIALIDWKSVGESVSAVCREGLVSEVDCQKRWMYLQNQRKSKFWTAEEDRLLLQGVEQFKGTGYRGSIDWAKVSCLLGGSRSYDQCRHRYSSMLSSGSLGCQQGPWQKEEDDALMKALLDFEMQNPTSGTINWVLVSQATGCNRSTTQCKNRWNKALKVKYPDLRLGPWSADEDSLLRSICSSTERKREEENKEADRKGDGDGEQIGMEFDTRAVKSEKTDDSCQDSDSEGDSDCSDSDEEEERDWEAVSREMGGGRSAHQCEARWRYMKSLGSDSGSGQHRSGTWTAEEDAHMVEAVQQYRNKDGSVDWNQVCASMKGERNATQCRLHWRNSLRYRSKIKGEMKSGGWTQEEEVKLAEAVKACSGDQTKQSSSGYMYKSIDWLAVVDMLGGNRTVDQCRRRWRGIVRVHDAALTLATAPPPVAQAEREWSVEEDERLYHGAVSLFFTPPVEGDGSGGRGFVNWEGVASHVGGGRTADQCSMRWQAALDAAAAAEARPVATLEPTQQLNHGTAFTIAETSGSIPGHDDSSTQHGISGGPIVIAESGAAWSREEEEKLMDAAEESRRADGEVDWNHVSSLMGGLRTATECRDHWSRDSPAPGSFKTGAWDAEEDARLMEAVESHFDEVGSDANSQIHGLPNIDWNKVVSMMGGQRSKQQCRHRWSSNLKHRGTGVRVGVWDADEDAQLLAAVKSLQEKNPGSESISFAAVSRLMGGSRTSSQCRRRWLSCPHKLDGAQIKSGAWSAEEDQRLIEALHAEESREGATSVDWARVADAMNHQRTAEQCRHHWTYSLKCKQAGARTGAWSIEEDEKLREAVQLYQGGAGASGVNWSRVVDHLNGTRSSRQCRDRWKTALKSYDSSTKLGQWSADEDRMLYEAYQAMNSASPNGRASWAVIAGYMDGRRTADQCCRRWRKVAAKYGILNREDGCNPSTASDSSDFED